jgi:DNA-binding response OmpR family regulator
MVKNHQPNILIVAREGLTGRELYASLAEKGYARSIVSPGENVLEKIDEPTDLVVVAGDSNAEVAELVITVKERRSVPIIALVTREMLASVNGYLDKVDDFIIIPGDPMELAFKVGRILRRINRVEVDEVIRCGDLTIDTAKCEVTVAGKSVELTFREYELLKFLASNQGRVFTRDVLLNNVWGYEYYGGDRTVDVHIRRLRSKIEDLDYSFIETVRNIGYKFRDGD